MSIALIDGNNFYVACERIFNPTLTGRPVVVLSNNDGCIVSRSTEAKALGIPMAAPWFRWRPFAEARGVIALSSNYALYGDMSQRMMTLLGAFSAHQEIYSIDECFLDLGEGSPQARQDIGRRIRAQMGRWLGLPVCVGMGPTKTLAKLANHWAKQGHPPSGQAIPGVCDLGALPPHRLNALLAQVPTREIWGIGPRLSQQLDRAGIATAAQLQRADPQRLQQHFSVTVARVALELRGQPCLDLADVDTPRQQILSSRSFARDVHDRPPLEAAMAHHVAIAAEKLRAQGSLCGLVQVFLRPRQFDETRLPISQGVPLPAPSDDTRHLTCAALAGTAKLYRPGVAYQKAGVVLSALSAAQAPPQDLFAPTMRNERLMGALDHINRRWGRGTLRSAAESLGEGWAMRQERLSPAYTTRWDELAVVRC